jgi:hypothetical protein
MDKTLEGYGLWPNDCGTLSNRGFSRWGKVKQLFPRGLKHHPDQALHRGPKPGAFNDIQVTKQFINESPA